MEDSKPVIKSEGVSVIKSEGVSVIKGEGVSAKAPVHSGKGTRNEDERDEGDAVHWQQRAWETQQHRETKQQNACAGRQTQGGTARKGPEGAHAQCPECRTELPLTREELRLSRMLTPQPSSEELEEAHEEVRPLGVTHVTAGGGGGGGGGAGAVGTDAQTSVGTDAQTSQQAAQGQSGAGGAAGGGGAGDEGGGGAEAAGDLVAGRGVIDRLSMDRSFQIREQFFPLDQVVCACSPAQLYRAHTHTQKHSRARALSHYVYACIEFTCVCVFVCVNVCVC
jgi:hypothetical protein